MKITVMGSGTSHGIPVIACNCEVCNSQDSRDKRLRASALIEHETGTEKSSVVIDVGPEFRIQALKFGIKKIDGVLITHSHADHCHGIDDLRIFSFKKPNKKETPGRGLPVYCNQNTRKDLFFRFAYALKKRNLGGGIPKLDLIAVKKFDLNSPVTIGGIQIFAIPVMHGRLKDNGWALRTLEKDGKFHCSVYLTDCKTIPEKSLRKIEELKNSCGGKIDHLIIDALREKTHFTHCNFTEALMYAEKINACHTWFTHISHETSHTGIEKFIEENLPLYPALKKTTEEGGSVRPLYDGMVLESDC